GHGRGREVRVGQVRRRRGHAARHAGYRSRSGNCPEPVPGYLRASEPANLAREEQPTEPRPSPAHAGWFDLRGQALTQTRACGPLAHQCRFKPASYRGALPRRVVPVAHGARTSRAGRPDTPAADTQGSTGGAHLGTALFARVRVQPLSESGTTPAHAVR